MNTEDGRALYAACQFFFGEFAGYIVGTNRQKSFNIDSGVEGNFIKNIDLGKAKYVKECFVQYAYEGPEYGPDSSYMHRTKQYPAYLIISFNEKQQDLRISIDGNDARDVLGRYFDLVVIGKVFAPILSAKNERIMNEERSRLVEERKKNIDKQILQHMVANFQNIFTQAMEAASKIDGFKALSLQDQKQAIASSAYSAFFKLFDADEAKNNPSIRSKFYESGNGMCRLLKVPVFL